MHCITIQSLKSRIPTPIFIGCVTLGKSLNLSVLLVLPLLNKDQEECLSPKTAVGSTRFNSSQALGFWWVRGTSKLLTLKAGVVHWTPPPFSEAHIMCGFLPSRCSTPVGTFWSCPQNQHLRFRRSARLYVDFYCHG